MGMHRLLIEGSVTLSGGQRQRLMIARALIGKPRLLFFDEETSALDNRTQSVVIQSLERLRTTRVVAHRLSTLGHADRIFVLAGGQLVEVGRLWRTDCAARSIQPVGAAPDPVTREK